jgi:hypothetical protein
VLHLGVIDESLVRLQDFYLCIRSGASNVSSGLYACWRTSLSDSIVYHELDPEKRECPGNVTESLAHLPNRPLPPSRSPHATIN